MVRLRRQRDANGAPVARRHLNDRDTPKRL